MLYFVQELIILGGQGGQLRRAGSRIWPQSLQGPRRQNLNTRQKGDAQNLPKDLSPRMQIRSVFVHVPVSNGYAWKERVAMFFRTQDQNKSSQCGRRLRDAKHKFLCCLMV